MELIKKIKKCNKNDKILYTQHARNEMINEKFGQIYETEVNESINNGVIIQEYPDDEPYPSVLIYGNTESKRPIHVVCAYNQEENIIVVITAYQPDPNLWENNTVRRKI